MKERKEEENEQDRMRERERGICHSLSRFIHHIQRHYLHGYVLFVARVSSKRERERDRQTSGGERERES